MRSVNGPPARHRRDPALVAEPLDPRPRHRDPAAQHRDVDLALGKTGAPFVDAHQLQRDLGMSQPPAPQQRGGLLLHGRPGMAEAQWPVAEARRVEQRFDVGQYPLGPAEQRPAGRSQLQVVRRAVHQPHAEARLELAQRAGQRGLAGVQHRGGRRDGAVLADGHEGAQVAQLDAHARRA
ncbi:MAG TPA: hypothetical protein VGM60_00040 [Pseudonocardia sp.]